MHRLIAERAKSLGARPADLYQEDSDAARGRAVDFGESCLLSVALWRRFGTAEFAEAVGWIDRTDYAAMSVLLSTGAVDAAVGVWRQGRHAACGHGAQQHVRSAELRAWQMGRAKREDVGLELPGVQGGAAGEDALTRARAAAVTPGGEAIVRTAYERLVNIPHRPFWDLWRKRRALVECALRRRGMQAFQRALGQVRGFCGPDQDAERAAWELAFDIHTMTPLTDDRGPVEWCGSYVSWLRRRLAEAQPSPRRGRVLQDFSPRRPAIVSIARDRTGLSAR